MEGITPEVRVEILKLAVQLLAPKAGQKAENVAADLATMALALHRAYESFDHPALPVEVRPPDKR